MSGAVLRRPKGFRSADLVNWAEFCEAPTFTLNSRLSGAPLRGIRYERAVHRHLLSRFPPSEAAPFYVPSRWIRFTTSDPREHGARFAQPDGLLVDFERALITIIEIKLTHTQNAWWGLRRLYEPLIRRIFGARWSFAVCEVCRWYDPGVAWPEPFELIRDPSSLRPNAFGVTILSSLGMIREEALQTAACVEFPVGIGKGELS